MADGRCLVHRTSAPPILEGVSRPLWSVMIPTYNCVKYLSETLSSVLLQDMGREIMQIEVVDDHSTDDDPGKVVEELGRGRVGFYRQTSNVGVIGNLETCLRRSQGKLIHLLHGDDYVRDGFYRKLQGAFEQNRGIGAAFCRQIFMDEHGHWQGISRLEQRESGILENWLEQIAVEQRIMTPSIVVRREVYETLGAFDCRLKCSEDWEMWVRIAAHYPMWYEVEPLAAYRMHSNSNTGRHLRSGENMEDTLRCIEIFKSYLPARNADRLSRKARETYAISGLNTAYSMFVIRDRRAAIAHIRKALKCRSSLRVIGELGRLAMRTATLSMQGELGKRAI